MVRLLSLSELDDLWVEFEAAVDATPEIDAWCSGLDWQIPVCSAFAPEAERLLLATENNDGFALLARYRDQLDAGLIGGLEPLWGFGTPIVGGNLTSVTAQLAATLGKRADWNTLLLPGMPLTAVEATEDGKRRAKPPPDGVMMEIAFGLSRLGQVHAAEGITRQIADLSGGYEDWLARRSPKFRRNLRQADARAAKAGLVIEDASADPDLFARLMAIEKQSWKGREGSGITSAEMSITYRLMIERLRDRGRLLAHVARLDECDVGYILGGVRTNRYRGLQLSFADASRHLSIGNLLQDHQLKQLSGNGRATTYDLGMDFGYKQRWADTTETSVTLVVQRS